MNSEIQSLNDRINDIHAKQGEYLQVYLRCFNKLNTLVTYSEELSDREVVEYTKRVLTDTTVKLDRLGNDDCDYREGKDNG